MKKHLLLIAASLLMAGSFMSCKKMGPLSEEYVKVKPSVLEAKAGKVEATITGTFPEKYFKKKVTVEVTPVLKYNGTEERLPSFRFQGEKVKGNDPVISSKTGGNYTQRISFDFKPGMEKSELYLQFSITSGKKTSTLPEMKIATGINTTYMLAKIEKIDPIFGEDAFQRSITEQQEADINFLVNQAEIRSSELKAEDIVALTEKLKIANADSKATIKGIEISGYASPEGTVDVNTGLATKREKAANKYVADQLKKIKTQISVDSKSTPEDWEGFQQLVAGSSMQDKELILSVLSMYTDPDVRETKIRELAAAYKVLADEILPQLRRSKLKVSLEIIGKSDEELIAIAQNTPDSLSVEELLYVANIATDMATKESIYTKAAALYPSDWRTTNNLGCVQFMKGDVASAKANFSKAYDLIPSGKAVNFNMALCVMQEGDMSKAEPFLGKAAGIGPKLDAALGVIYLYKGDYGAANKALAAEKSNNAIIAKLVVGELAAAQKIVAEIGAGANAKTSYLKAIIAARSGDKEGVFSNLKDAAADAELKTRAKTDIEFTKYWADASFTSIVQ